MRRLVPGSRKRKQKNTRRRISMARTYNLQHTAHNMALQPTTWSPRGSTHELPTKSICTDVMVRWVLLAAGLLLKVPWRTVRAATPKEYIAGRIRQMDPKPMGNDLAKLAHGISPPNRHEQHHARFVAGGTHQTDFPRVRLILAWGCRSLNCVIPQIPVATADADGCGKPDDIARATRETRER